jgi:PiT family inorganic phosphate transporter
VLILLVGLALFFNFLSGILDSSNIVAMPVSSNSIHPRLALLLAAMVQIVAPFIFGLAVARTIGNNLLNVEFIHLKAIVAGLAAAVVWLITTWRLGIPSSSSHALIGGIVGASVAANGWAAVNISTLVKVFFALFISPPLGMVLGYFVTRVVFLVTRNASPSINAVFRRSQFVTLTGLALSYGANDAQKGMGILSLGLVSAGVLPAFTIPTWVLLVTSSAIALGMFLGGWRLIRTLGGKIYHVRPVHAFSSQVAGACVVFAAALSGVPVSTTQVMSSSIVGAGAADRINKVRWTILEEMATAWLLTIPFTAVLAGAMEILLR